ncbi:MAG: surface lipoprotein assembly modifier [bacterium]
MLHRGRYRDALAILRPLARPQRADITDIRFLIGLAAIQAATARGEDHAAHDDRAALLAEAIAALRAIVVAHPRLLRVRLELARAFFLNGDDALARRHFELALDADPPRAVAVNARRFLHALRARRRWSGYFSVNLEQSDNINGGPETRVIYLHGLPFTLSEDTRPRAETGLSIAGGVEYQHPLSAPDSTRATRAGEWRWRFGADLRRAEYEDHALDQTYAQARTGPRFQIGQRTQVDATAFYGRRWVDANRHSRRHGLRIKARHRLSAKVGANAGASFEKVRHERANRMRDERIADYALGASYLFSPLLQGSVDIGHERNVLDSSRGSSADRASLGAAAILPRGWTLGAEHELLRRDHRAAGVNTAGARQRDRKRTARVFVLNRGFTALGFSPQLIITRERQDSNAPLSHYRRTRADLRWVRQY